MSKNLKILQLHKMNDIINLATENRREDDFKSVTYRKKLRKHITKFYGENENDDFAIGRKVWLYLYRIKRHITSEKIKKFITSQPQFKDADIVIKELPTQDTQNKCFMFGIDWNLRDDIYKPSIWPSSMAFKRFDFKRYHNYQNQSTVEEFRILIYLKTLEKIVV